MERTWPFRYPWGVIGGSGEGQAGEERGRRELGGGHLAGAFGRVRKAEVRPNEEAEAGSVSRDMRGTLQFSHWVSFQTVCHRLAVMRLNRELIKYGFPAPPPDILP